MSKFSTESAIIVDLKPKMSGPPVKVSDFILNEILQSNHAGPICIQAAVATKQKQKVDSSLQEFADEYGNGSTSVQHQRGHDVMTITV